VTRAGFEVRAFIRLTTAVSALWKRLKVPTSGFDRLTGHLRAHNDFGFLETPYAKSRMAASPIILITHADREENLRRRQANATIDDKGHSSPTA